MPTMPTSALTQHHVKFSEVGLYGSGEVGRIGLGVKM